MIAQIAAALAVALLRHLQEREDLKASIRAELEKETLRSALKAMEWKSRAVGRADAHELRVRRPGARLTLSDRDADDDGRAPLP